MNIFKRRSMFFLLCAAVLFQCGKNPASPEQATVNEMQKKVDDISIDVAAVRGMNYLRPVHVKVISREEYAASVTKELSSSISSVEAAALSKEYAQIGFLTETDTPFTKVLADFYSSFPAAFYTLGTDSLTIIKKTDMEELQLNSIIAHELTHALQDQQLNTRPSIFPEYSNYNSDALIARRSLLEGDAMFTEFAYMYKIVYAPNIISSYDSSRALVLNYKMELLAEAYPADHPVFLDIKYSVPYYFGATFVAEKYHASFSWSTVNNLYSISAVPRSSAEINRMTPVSIAYFDFHAIQSLLVSQIGIIEFADDDNAGFALLLGLFYGDIDTVRVRRSLDWSGDRYTYVKRKEQAYGTLVWSMEFTSEEAAKYLFGKLASKIGSRRLGGIAAVADSVIDTSGHESAYTFTSTSVTTKIRRVDNQIWWLENTDTLTQRIMDMLEAQKSAPSLAKGASINTFPTSLSAETKRLVLEGIMKQMFKRKAG